MFAFLIKKYIAYLEDQRKVREKKNSRPVDRNTWKKLKIVRKKKNNLAQLVKLLRRDFVNNYMATFDENDPKKSEKYIWENNCTANKQIIVWIHYWSLTIFFRFFGLLFFFWYCFIEAFFCETNPIICKKVFFADGLSLKQFYSFEVLKNFKLAD